MYDQDVFRSWYAETVTREYRFAVIWKSEETKRTWLAKVVWQQQRPHSEWRIEPAEDTNASQRFLVPKQRHILHSHTVELYFQTLTLRREGGIVKSGAEKYWHMARQRDLKLWSTALSICGHSVTHILGQSHFFIWGIVRRVQARWTDPVVQDRVLNSQSQSRSRAGAQESISLKVNRFLRQDNFQ